MKMTRKKPYLISQRNKKFVPKEFFSRRPKDIKIFPLRYIWNRVHSGGKDCIVLICGATGSGKTTLATALCELLDRNETGAYRFPHLTKEFSLRAKEEGFNFDNLLAFFLEPNRFPRVGIG